MDAKTELAEAKRRQQQTVAELNQVRQHEQALLQELLRLEGEIRALQRLSKDGAKHD